MAFPKTLVPWFLLLVLVNNVLSQEATSFTFDSFSTSIDTLTFQADAFVPSSSSFVRLIKANGSQPSTYSTGRLVYSPPVKFWDVGTQATFEATIKFVITPGGGRPPADGLTFFIAPVDSPIPQGSYGGNLGLFDPSTGLALSAFAVEFDSYSNAWDPSYPHIGIDINSKTSRNVSRFENATGTEVTARINYDSSTRSITVFATYGSGQNSSLSYNFDLKTILPKEVQVGISAATGSPLTAFYDLHAWYFSSTLVWDGNSLDKTHIRQQ